MKEKRIGWEGSEIGKSPGSECLLVLIDNDTSKLYHWKLLDPVQLGRFGIYNLWRVDRLKLNKITNTLRKEFRIESDWKDYNPERY